jgi:hypothetical protein
MTLYSVPANAKWGVKVILACITSATRGTRRIRLALLARTPYDEAMKSITLNPAIQVRR